MAPLSLVPDDERHLHLLAPGHGHGLTLEEGAEEVEVPAVEGEGEGEDRLLRGLSEVQLRRKNCLGLEAVPETKRQT